MYMWMYKYTRIVIRFVSYCIYSICNKNVAINLLSFYSFPTSLSFYMRTNCDCQMVLSSLSLSLLLLFLLNCVTVNLKRRNDQQSNNISNHTRIWDSASVRVCCVWSMLNKRDSNLFYFGFFSLSVCVRFDVDT